MTLGETEREAFEDVPSRAVDLFPEVGTRAFVCTVLAVSQGLGSAAYAEGWMVVQPDRYRYAVEPDGNVVRMVLSEHLACMVAWE